MSRRFTLGTTDIGRVLHVDGRPALALRRYVENGTAALTPTECDALAAHIVRLLQAAELPRTASTVSPAMAIMLHDLAGRGMVWWHYLRHPTRQKLWRDGCLVRVPRQAPCHTHGASCPGYVRLSRAGLALVKALNK